MNVVVFKNTWKGGTLIKHKNVSVSLQSCIIIWGKICEAGISSYLFELFFFFFLTIKIFLLLSLHISPWQDMRHMLPGNSPARELWKIQTCCLTCRDNYRVIEFAVVEEGNMAFWGTLPQLGGIQIFHIHDIPGPMFKTNLLFLFNGCDEWVKRSQKSFNLVSEIWRKRSGEACITLSFWVFIVAITLNDCKRTQIFTISLRIYFTNTPNQPPVDHRPVCNSI